MCSWCDVATEGFLKLGTLAIITTRCKAFTCNLAKRLVAMRHETQVFYLGIDSEKSASDSQRSHSEPTFLASSSLSLSLTDAVDDPTEKPCWRLLAVKRPWHCDNSRNICSFNTLNHQSKPDQRCVTVAANVHRCTEEANGITLREDSLISSLFDSLDRQRFR